MFRIQRISRALGFRMYQRIKATSRTLLKSVHGLPVIESKDLGLDRSQVFDPILDDICLPPYIAPRDHDDFQPLMRIVSVLQPSIVVELGTAHGNTVANICRICPSTKIYTVNALESDQTGNLVTYALSTNQIGRVYRKYGYSSQVIQIFKNTLDLNLSEYNIEHNSVNLAIIDACHDTDYVINDFFKVLPFINSHGVILFHDTHPSMNGHLAGSYLACMKLRQKGYHIRYLRNTWWGIWCRNEAFFKRIK